MAHIVIIGNGIAGATAALEIRRQGNHEITMISSETQYPYARTALMYVFMGHMRWQDTKLYEDTWWSTQNICLMYSHVDDIDYKNKQIHLNTGTYLYYDKLIIATGSKAKKMGLPNEDASGIHYLQSIHDVKKLEKAIAIGVQNVVVVGGGLTGIEMAEMMYTRNMNVTMLIRENSYGRNFLPEEESLMIHQHIVSHGIVIKQNSEVVSILSKDNKISSIIVKKDGQELPCDLLTVTIGVSPNMSFSSPCQVETNVGILVDDHLQTSIADVYAIGDCAEFRNPEQGRKAIEANWYTAKKMGKIVASTICGSNEKYHQGIWHNAAKFFDIEYQVYGTIITNVSPSIESFYWSHPTKNISIRINFHKTNKKVVGMCSLGLRLRQNICTLWIEKGIHVEEVLVHFRKANFDPEFSEKFEEEILCQYNLQQNTSLTLLKDQDLYSIQ